MCQHDFDGNRVFQHRNMAKWDLLAENPRIPGYLYEDESREFLRQLRAKWNGRLNWKKPIRRDFSGEAWKQRNKLVKELIADCWLLDDRRALPSNCCGPPVKWSKRSFSKPWVRPMPQFKHAKISEESFEVGILQGLDDVASVKSSDIDNEMPHAASGQSVRKIRESDPNVIWSRGLRCREVAFADDSTLSQGASPEAYWWDLEQGQGTWVLYLINEKGRVARMTPAANGRWMGRWLKKPGGVVGLKRVEAAFPVLKAETRLPEIPTNSLRPEKPLHAANHAHGIGDAVTGLHAAAAIAEEGRTVVYHTRFARWLQRASHPRLTVTETAPPKGSRDMDADYAEQLRYAPDKVAWYAGQAGRQGWTRLPLSRQKQGKASGTEGLKGKIGIDQNGLDGERRLAGKGRMAGKRNGDVLHPLTINREVGIPRLDFPKYVLLAPFAAWEARDWPETHWRRLAWQLKEAGYEIVAIGTKAEAERMERTFNKSYAYWAIDHDPEWIMDAMLDAAAVIGLDSGMIHVAGLLRVPAVCIHSHLPPEFLFSHAPTVKSVRPATGCVFCRWQEDRGFMEGCATACSAMATVGPEEVMRAFLSCLGPAAGDDRVEDNYLNSKKY